MPLNPDGSCAHPYMIPNKGRTACVFAARLDIGRHFVRGGGRTGLKESYERLVSRMLSFNKFLFASDETLANVSEFATLFHSQAYRDAAAEVCELGVPAPVTEPFQLGIIIQIPGQTVPMHYDAPYFLTGGRFDIPIWLLVAMQFSGLWEAQRVHQIQGVAYIHKWPANKVNGGAFFYYPEGPGGKVSMFESVRNNAILLDGSQLVHGTDPFRPLERDVLMLDRSAKNELVFIGNSRWHVQVDGKPVAEYGTDDLRISLVWRSFCFRTSEERTLFKTDGFGKRLTVDGIMDRFAADLVRRGRLRPGQTLPNRLDLSLLILDEYVQYPLSDTWLPLNYCALPRLVSAEYADLATRLVSGFCQ